MNTQSTIEKMKQLSLHGMSQVYHRSLSDHLYTDYSLDEFIALLIDTEWEEREKRRIDYLTKTAGFKFDATNIDYTAKRNLDKTIFERLLSLQFMKKAENIIITGPSGIGKSYLAQAVGYVACRDKYKTLYYNTGRLQEDIKLSKIEGTYIKLLRKLKRAQLLIIDDFGLHPFDNDVRQAFFDIIEDRNESLPTIITSQIPVKGWHEVIGEGTIADAILDRLVYSSHRIEMTGESLRKTRVLNA